MSVSSIKKRKPIETKQNKKKGKNYGFLIVKCWLLTFICLKVFIQAGERSNTHKRKKIPFKSAFLNL